MRNFSWKIIKMIPWKTKIPLFLLISSSIYGWNDLYGHIIFVWRKWNTLPSISMEISSLRSEKWWNFSWKIIKMTPEKTKIPLFHLKSSSICLEMTNMVIYVWFEENEIHYRQFPWKFRVFGAKNGISA